MDLGVNIKKARVNAGMTQTQLAEKMGVQQRDISRWEHNKRTPNVETLGKICEAVGISMDEITESKANGSKHGSEAWVRFINMFNHDAGKMDLIREYVRITLPPEDIFVSNIVDGAFYDNIELDDGFSELELSASAMYIFLKDFIENKN